jgi:hypothetical protein
VSSNRQSAKRTDACLVREVHSGSEVKDLPMLSYSPPATRFRSGAGRRRTSSRCPHRTPFARRGETACGAARVPGGQGRPLQGTPRPARLAGEKGGAPCLRGFWCKTGGVLEPPSGSLAKPERAGQIEAVRRLGPRRRASVMFVEGIAKGGASRQFSHAVSSTSRMPSSPQAAAPQPPG